jgi:hypothetical protein
MCGDRAVHVGLVFDWGGCHALRGGLSGGCMGMLWVHVVCRAGPVLRIHTSFTPIHTYTHTGTHSPKPHGWGTHAVWGAHHTFFREGSGFG